MDFGESSECIVLNADSEESCDEIDKIDESDAIYESNQNEFDSDFSVEAASNLEYPPKILILNDDCFGAIFDHSPVKDLIAMGNTCKHIHQLAGPWFAKTCSNIRIECGSDGVGVYTDAGYVNVNHFAEFIRKINMITSFDGLKFLLKKHTEFHRLEQIEIYDVRLTPNEINVLEPIWKKIKVLRMLLGCSSANYHEILDHCSNLRRLEVIKCVFDYNCCIPTLEYLQIIPNTSQYLGQLAVLLADNPNIRKFATTANCLWQNRDVISKRSDITLDDLAIRIDKIEEYKSDSYSFFLRARDDNWFASFCHLLNELYEHGTYKRLQLYFRPKFRQRWADELATVNGLTKLHFKDCDSQCAFSALRNLEELYIHNGESIDLNGAATSLINLKRIHFCAARLDKIIPLIKRSVTLKKIRIDYLQNGSHFNARTNAIDLAALYRERQQSTNAYIIKLYVEEKVYLGTKGALKGIEFDSIQLKRQESFEWNHDFDCHYYSNNV